MEPGLQAQPLALPDSIGQPLHELQELQRQAHTLAQALGAPVAAQPPTLTGGVRLAAAVEAASEQLLCALHVQYGRPSGGDPAAAAAAVDDCGGQAAGVPVLAAAQHAEFVGLMAALQQGNCGSKVCCCELPTNWGCLGGARGRSQSNRGWAAPLGAHWRCLPPMAADDRVRLTTALRPSW
jgi:hypothetical protein